MKLRCFIGAFLFLALTACHRPVETCHGASLTSELVSIDSLMQFRPDSDPNLSNGDLTYCCLYLLGLSDADVSALMQKEYPTVSEHSRKIKRILGDKTLVTTLRNFSYSSDL